RRGVQRLRTCQRPLPDRWTHVHHVNERGPTKAGSAPPLRGSQFYVPCRSCAALTCRNRRPRGASTAHARIQSISYCAKSTFERSCETRPVPCASSESSDRRQRIYTAVGYNFHSTARASLRARRNNLNWRERRAPPKMGIFTKYYSA